MASAMRVATARFFVPWAFLFAAQFTRGYTAAVSRVKCPLLSDRVFFITVNLRKDRPKFTRDEYPLLIGAFEQSRRKLDFSLCGYVLMPDHWHAPIGVHDPLTISRVVQHIKWISARRINHNRNSTGPLWQHQFWDRFVRHDKEFGHRLAYMHLNPVRKGLVKNPAEWNWSSFSNFALEQSHVARCPIQIDHVDFPTA
jgi:putative transposase